MSTEANKSKQINDSNPISTIRVKKDIKDRFDNITIDWYKLSQDEKMRYLIDFYENYLQSKK